MSNQPTAFDGVAAFTRMWGDFASKMAAAAVAAPMAGSTPEAARELRSAWLRGWADYCDQFMRSPEFIDVIRQSLNSSVDMRRQMNDFLGRPQHEFQGVSRQDVDELMLAVRHLEHRLVDGLERLSDRLDRLIAELHEGDDAATGRHADNGKARRSKRPARKESQK